MLATYPPLRDRSEPGDGHSRGPVSVQWTVAPPAATRQDTPDADRGDPDAPGISLCERERRWACEWWPPD